MSKRAGRQILVKQFQFATLIGMAVVCGLFAPHSSIAAEWHFTPSLSLGGEYSDNFYRSEQNPTRVWVMQTAPGVEVEGLSDRSRLSLKYKMGYFAHFGSNDSVDVSSQDYLGHDLSFFAATRVFTRLVAGLSEEFILTREPGASDTLSQIISRDKYWRNRISPFLSYDVAEKGEVKIAYRNEALNYIDAVDGSKDDSTENRGILTLTYHMNPRNHFDFECQVWHRDYTGASSGYDSYQPQLIYRREMSSWLMGRVAAGYQWRKFDQSDVKDLETPAFSVGLVGGTERTRFNVALEYNLVDFTQGDAYFNAYRMSAFVERRYLNDVIRAYAGGYYQMSNYEYSPREDKEWSLRTGVGYSFWDKRMELSAEYGYTNRDSNQSGFGYTENTVSLKLAYKFDFPKR
ncbi:MAG: outer membrane beta-barrel protein [Desulfobacteraceae bacterium]|nr:outer membrane beta-barrel protein [Desulfobacteraceae bacterium]